MTMPIDLVLVRHGESEGNWARQRSIEGDHSAFTLEFKARHPSQWRLTDLGRDQSRIAGEWIKENISVYFDRYYVSDFIRARETAGLLALPGAVWQHDHFLHERNIGSMSRMSEKELRNRFGAELGMRKIEPYYWLPPMGGESMVQMMMRVSWHFDELRRECNDMGAIEVDHGEVMWAMRIILEHLTPGQLRRIRSSSDPRDSMHNGQILHYTRRDPEPPYAILPQHDWMRSICPWDLTRSSNVWQKIERPTYTNEELLAEAERYPRRIT